MLDQVFGERCQVGRLKEERRHQRQVIGFVDGIGQGHKTDRVKPVVGEIPCQPNLLCWNLLHSRDDLDQIGFDFIEKPL